MLRLLRYFSFSLLVLAGLQASLPAADGDGKGPAFTEAPKNDANFALMGEFVGEITTGKDEKKLLGLQIRPVGNNAFDALSFLGGLPGQEGYEPKPIRMIGRRSDDFVILSGGPWAIFVETDHCLLLDREGNKVGRLERIQRTSPTLGAPPPKDAIVLFDGNNIDQFTNAQMTEDGLLMQGADIKPMFQDFNLHVEFRIPYMPQADGQSRGNSGLYLQSRYECQVLDSFALDPLFNGLGSLYRFKAPDVNMAFPPLVWQTYDVQFTAPRWAADGSKIRDAHVSSWINGVKVQDNVALPNKTGAGKPEEPVLLPTRIQDHGDPVRFRNIWVIDRGLATGEFPVYPTPEQLKAAAEAEQRKAEQEAKAEQERKQEEQKKQAEEQKKQAERAAKEKAEQKPEGEKPQPAATPEKQPEANEAPAEASPEKPDGEGAAPADSQSNEAGAAKPAAAQDPPPQPEAEPPAAESQPQPEAGNDGGTGEGS